MNTDPRRRPLSRRHHVPIRKQLAADLESQIRDGQIRPGARLPSSRDLARKMDVDRGIVASAFARLRRRGLVITHPGKRPCVSSAVREEEKLELLQLISFEQEAIEAAQIATASLLRTAFEEGIPRRIMLNELFHIADQDDQIPDVTLYDPCPGMRATLTAEIQFRCKVTVHPVDTLKLAIESEPVLVRRDLLGRLRSAHGLECLPISLAGGTYERDLARSKVRKGLVALLSRSGLVRDFATELAAREFDRGVSFIALDPESDRAGTMRTLAAARFVFYDRACVEHARSAPGATAPIRLIPPQEIDALRRYLGTTEFG